MIELNAQRISLLYALTGFFFIASILALLYGGKDLPIISVIIFLSSLLLCLIILSNRMALLSPMFMFCFLQLTLFSLSWLPFITTDFLWNDTYYNADSHSVLNAIIKLNLLTSFWIIIATLTHISFKFKSKWRSIDTDTNFKIIGIFIVILSLISFSILISKAGSIFEILIQRELSREDRISTEIGRHWFALAQIGTLGLALWAFSDKFTFKTWYFYPIFFLSILVGFIVSGNRTSIVMSSILIYAAWSFHSKKIISPSIILMILLLISTLGFATLIREEGITSLQNDGYDNRVSQIDTLKKIWEIRAERSVSGSANLGILISLENGAPYILGESYKSIPYIPIPSAILSYPKPPAGGKLAAFKLSGRTDTAWPISPVIEAYWNFGIFGVIFSALLYGMLSSIIFSIMKNNYKSTILIVGYFSYITLFSVGSDGFYKFLQAGIPLFILYVLLKILFLIKSFVLNSRNYRDA